MKLSRLPTISATSGYLVVIALVVGPFWATYFAPVPAITVGRVLVVTAVAAACVLLVRSGIKGVLRSEAVLLAMAAAALLGWMAFSAWFWGCFCRGTFYGFVEVSAFGFAVAVVASVAPRFRWPILLAAASGVVVGGALAVAGVRDVHTGGAISAASGRLAGVYGNPNFLALAVAIVLPVLVVVTFQARGWRPIAGAALLLALVIIGLTLSRSGFVAATAGVVVAIGALFRSRRRALVLLVSSFIGVVGVAAAAYPVYADRRLDADFGKALAALQARDVSGWDGTKQGLIPSGNAELRNESQGRVIAITSTGPGEGASFPWGTAVGGIEHVLALKIRSRRGSVAVHVGLEDNLKGNGPRSVAASVATRWRRVVVRWRPTTASSAARLYVWQTSGNSMLLLRNVTIARHSPGGVRVSTIPTRLRGSVADAGGADALRAEEGRFVESRLDAVRLAAEAFAAEPVHGIGWERFPEHAEDHGEFGLLASHNEYARVAAELGLVGLVLFVLTLAAGLLWATRQRDRDFRAALLGMQSSAVVGMLFVNALGTTSSLAMAVAIGLACARPSESPRPLHDWRAPPELSMGMAVASIRVAAPEPPPLAVPDLRPLVDANARARRVVLAAPRALRAVLARRRAAPAPAPTGVPPAGSGPRVVATSIHTATALLETRGAVPPPAPVRLAPAAWYPRIAGAARYRLSGAFNGLATVAPLRTPTLNRGWQRAITFAPTPRPVAFAYSFARRGGRHGRWVAAVRELTEPEPVRLPGALAAAWGVAARARALGPEPRAVGRRFPDVPPVAPETESHGTEN
jgi:hypothetical protein